MPSSRVSFNHPFRSTSFHGRIGEAQLAAEAAASPAAAVAPPVESAEASVEAPAAEVQAAPTEVAEPEQVVDQEPVDVA